jgi:hypothetical protein
MLVLVVFFIVACAVDIILMHRYLAAYLLGEYFEMAFHIVFLLTLLVSVFILGKYI